MRAQGAGGQNVNKVSSAVHLRFDVAASSLPDAVKARLLGARDRRISDEGVIVIKAQRHRSQDLNRRDALARLNALVARAAEVPRGAQADAADARRRANAGSKARAFARRSRPGAPRSSTEPGRGRPSGALEGREQDAEGDEEAAEDAVDRAPARRRAQQRRAGAPRAPRSRH